MVWDAFPLGQISHGKVLPQVCGTYTLHCGRGGIKIPGVASRCRFGHFHLGSQFVQFYKYDSIKNNAHCWLSEMNVFFVLLLFCKITKDAVPMVKFMVIMTGKNQAPHIPYKHDWKLILILPKHFNLHQTYIKCTF